MVGRNDVRRTGSVFGLEVLNILPTFLDDKRTDQYKTSNAFLLYSRLNGFLQRKNWKIRENWINNETNN